VTAYDDLATYQFKSGKAYDKRSVEEFRAAALTALDDALRHSIQIEDQLAGANPVAFQASVASTPTLTADEQDLLTAYRAMEPFDRFDLLQRVCGQSAAGYSTDPPPTNPVTNVTGWDEPAGWSDEPAPSPVTAFEPLSAEPDHSPGLSFDTWTPQAPYAPQPSLTWPQSAPAEVEPLPAESATPSYEPDWLSDWESAVPEGDEPAAEPSFGWDSPTDTTSNVAGAWSTAPQSEPAAFVPPPMNDAHQTLGWGEEAPATHGNRWEDQQPATSLAEVSAGSYQPWRAEVGIPEQADVVETFGNLDEARYNDERLEVLFNQLDFGPPSSDLLPPSATHSIASAENHQGSPLRVEQTLGEGQPLPPPVRPWEGWIR
jgi:hypothetical protein